MSATDTIVALSSGGLPAGIAVIRISGPLVVDVISTMVGDSLHPRRAALRPVKDLQGSVLDRALVLFFPGPSSFTGEDCLELHVHGGRALVDAVIETACSLGCRVAEAGEFMRRAFLNGKTDLLGAESAADLISAETAAQLRFASFNADGGHAALYEGWRRRLIHARAMIEANLDFSDEGDVDPSEADETQQQLEALILEIRAHIGGFRRAEIIRDGLDVVILGPPNAGKSSLLNALAGREVAIVTDEPGTTRDLIEVALDLEGYKVRVTDSAGVREPGSKVEAMGIERAMSRAARADLIIMLSPLDGIKADFARDLVAPKLPVISKADLAREGDREFDGLGISVLTGEGMDALIEALTSFARRAGSGSDVIPWRRRHVDLLNEATKWLDLSLNADLGMELVAEHLRRSTDAIGRIGGAVDVEDLLDVIFSQFCIGK